jgi:hypothetical protein
MEMAFAAQILPEFRAYGRQSGSNHIAEESALHDEVPKTRRIGKFLCAGRLDSWQVTETRLFGQYSFYRG